MCALNTNLQEMLKCYSLIEFIRFLWGNKKKGEVTDVARTQRVNPTRCHLQFTHHVTHGNAGHLQHGCVSDAFGRVLPQRPAARQQLLHHLDRCESSSGNKSITTTITTRLCDRWCHKAGGVKHLFPPSLIGCQLSVLQVTFKTEN